jgi:hypothetical protein
MDQRDEAMLVLLAGHALQGMLSADETVSTARVAFLAAEIARSTLHYIRFPDAPPPAGVRSAR